MIKLLSSIREESAEWRIRCDTCGHEKSLLSAGGVRWKARGRKHTVGICTACRRLRGLTIYHATRGPLPSAAQAPADAPTTPSPPR